MKKQRSQGRGPVPTQSSVKRKLELGKRGSYKIRRRGTRYRRPKQKI